MQTQHRPNDPRQRQSIAVARQPDQPLSDWAVVSLLGGTYLGGLTLVVGVLYAFSQSF
jgi:hypothetical protein